MCLFLEGGWQMYFAAEFPGKSEPKQQQKGWEVGRGIREEEGVTVRRRKAEF